MLSGHTDTVPFDEDRWSGDPFTLREQDQRWYGLGTADMKGFFAVVLEAIRGLDLDSLKQPLILLATADEESSMCGARSLLDAQRRLGRHAVIGEPTGLRPIRIHKGITMESIRVTGSASHSSNPLFDVEAPTLNLGHIHGGDNPNRICGECELHFDIRPLPGMSLEQLRAELDRRLAGALDDTALRLERQPLFEGIPAMETAAGTQIVRATEQLTGVSAEAVAFGTEDPFLNALGMETMILGPGSIDQAHQPDEYIALDQLEPAMRIIRGLVERFCR